MSIEEQLELAMSTLQYSYDSLATEYGEAYANRMTDRNWALSVLSLDLDLNISREQAAGILDELQLWQ